MTPNNQPYHISTSATPIHKAIKSFKTCDWKIHTYLHIPCSRSLQCMGQREVLRGQLYGVQFMLDPPASPQWSIVV